MQRAFYSMIEPFAMYSHQNKPKWPHFCCYVKRNGASTFCHGMKYTWNRYFCLFIHRQLSLEWPNYFLFLFGIPVCRSHAVGGRIVCFCLFGRVWEKHHHVLGQFIGSSIMVQLLTYLTINSEMIWWFIELIGIAENIYSTLYIWLIYLFH